MFAANAILAFELIPCAIIKVEYQPISNIPVRPSRCANFSTSVFYSDIFTASTGLFYSTIETLNDMELNESFQAIVTRRNVFSMHVICR